MLKLLKQMLVEELSYSGTLHVRHVRMSPTVKCLIVELLVLEGKISIDEHGFIYLVDNRSHARNL